MQENVEETHFQEALIKAQETISLLQAQISILEQKNNDLEDQATDLCGKLSKAQDDIRILKNPQNEASKSFTFKIFRLWLWVLILV